MRFLADENFPGEAVEALQALGNDVTWVRRIAPGTSNVAVFALAVADDRVLITFDKDFGAFVFRSPLPLPPAVILFRVPPLSSEYLTRVTTTVIQSRGDWLGHFSVVDESRVRMIPLPTR